MRSIFRRRRRHSVVETEYGTVLLDETNGQYWHLNDSAAVIVRELLAGRRPDDAAEALVQAFDVDATTARRDVDATHAELRSAGLA